MIPQYSTELFTDIWSNLDDFKTDVLASPLSVLKEESLNQLFYLLYAEYGNSPIANNDVEQFKFKVYSVMFKFGPTWEKRVEIQKRLRALTEDDILKGGKAIYNQALNPSSEPSTSTLDEITTINAQNTTNFKKSFLEGYAALSELLETDVTSEFIRKFKVCFKQFVMPENPVLYVTEGD